MIKAFVLVSMLLLGACTTATISTADGTAVEFTRVWSDVTFTLTPDGTMSYSSNADTNTALLQSLLSGQIVVP